MKKRFMSIVLLMMLVAALSQAAYASSDSASESVENTALMEIPAPITGEITTDSITKHGNIRISISNQDFFDAGYKFGDIVTMSFLDKTLDIPFGNNYTIVDVGETALVAKEDETDLGAGINMGVFASEYGIATKVDQEDGSFIWKYQDGVEGPVKCTISMKEPGGYYAMFMVHQLSYTDERDDYKDLTDEEFANFRNVATTGMGKNTLYRTASPVDPEHKRNAYADQALKDHGVTVIMNLADDETKLQEYPAYKDTYYASVEHIALRMSMDYMEEASRKKIADGLRFFITHPGVYAIHCQEGKDRTGVVCALLECLMGASLDEVVSDYMVTFRNYYGVKPGDDKYPVICQGNVMKTLKRLFGIEDLETADLSACAQEYLKSIGLTADEIEALKTNLGTDHM